MEAAAGTWSNEGGRNPIALVGGAVAIAVVALALAGAVQAQAQAVTVERIEVVVRAWLILSRMLSRLSAYGPS